MGFDVLGRGNLTCDMRVTVTQHDTEYWEYSVPRFATGRRKKVTKWFLSVNLQSEVRVYTFSFGKLAAQAAGYAFLISIAKATVVFIAQYLMQHKQDYKKLMVELSHDFNPDNNKDTSRATDPLVNSSPNSQR